MMKTVLTALVVVFACAQMAIAQDKDAWNQLNENVVIRCGDPDAPSRGVPPFQGFKDECDNTSIAPYHPEDSTAQLDLVIDPRDGQDLLCTREFIIRFNQMTN
jgi:hypothetical protein